MEWNSVLTALFQNFQGFPQQMEFLPLLLSSKTASIYRMNPRFVVGFFCLKALESNLTLKS